jgi:Ca2+-binding EF-hand superfamily protein
MSKRELQEKDLKTILAKDIGAKNPSFSADHIADLHAVFSLYADPRQRRADVRDILLTASTLGLDAKYEFVFRLIHEIHDQTGGNALDFEGFLKELTTRIVFLIRLRAAPSATREGRPTLPCWTLRERASLTLLTLNTSTSS